MSYNISVSQVIHETNCNCQTTPIIALTCFVFVYDVGQEFTKSVEKKSAMEDTISWMNCLQNLTTTFSSLLMVTANDYHKSEKYNKDCRNQRKYFYV